jgi:hypothetical protein
MKLLDEQFRAGQADYQRGVGLRTVIDDFQRLLNGKKDDEAYSRAFGYLDGVVASIRRTDNLLLMPAGPDK